MSLFLANNPFINGAAPVVSGAAFVFLIGVRL